MKILRNRILDSSPNVIFETKRGVAEVAERTAKTKTNDPLISAALSPASASPRFAFSMNRFIFDAQASKIPVKLLQRV